MINKTNEVKDEYEMTYQEKLERKERLGRERHEQYKAEQRAKYANAKTKKSADDKPIADCPVMRKRAALKAAKQSEPKVKMKPKTVEVRVADLKAPRSTFGDSFKSTQIYLDMKFEENPALIEGITVGWYSPRYKVAVDVDGTWANLEENVQKAKLKKTALQKVGIAFLRVKENDLVSYDHFMKRLGIEYRKRKHYEYRTMKKKVEKYAPRSLRDIKYPDKRVDTNPVRNQERDKLFAEVVNEIDLKKKLPF